MKENEMTSPPGEPTSGGAALPPHGSPSSEYSQPLGAQSQVPPQGGHVPPRRGFFDSVRASGYLRAEPRVVGGVLSGLSLRYGWDTTMLRVVTVVASLFFPLTAAAYALAWFFLPEQRDGRIHAEALTLGYFDIAQLGALLMFLIGMGNSGLYIIGLPILFWPVLVVGIGVLIYFVVDSDKRRSRGAAPTYPGAAPFVASPAGMPSVPGEAPAPAFVQTPPNGNMPFEGADWRSQGGPVADTAFVGAPAPDYRQSAYAPPASPYYLRPLQRPRRLSNAVNLLVTGLVVLVFAGVFGLLFLSNPALTTSEAGTIILVGGGICLLLVAIPMALAALRDRSAGWLVALSIFGMMLAGPVILGGNAMQYDSARWVVTDSSPFGWDEDHTTHWDSSVNSIGSVGNATWDLSDLPEGDTDVYQAEDILGHLTIYVRKGQEIEINVDSAIGVVDAEYLDDSSAAENDWVRESLGINSGLTMRSISDPNKPITKVNIASVLGTLEIVEVEDPRDDGHRLPGRDAQQSGPASGDRAQSAAPADAPQSTRSR